MLGGQVAERTNSPKPLQTKTKPQATSSNKKVLKISHLKIFYVSTFVVSTFCGHTIIHTVFLSNRMLTRVVFALVPESSVFFTKWFKKKRLKKLLGVRSGVY
jgi:hypothetical protein